MAARRLVAVLIVMLVLSTIAAVLVPAPRRPIGSSSTTTTTRSTTTNRGDSGGRLVTATINVNGPRRRPPVRLRVGDELRLRVVSTRPHQVVLGGFGIVEAVDRNAPALFDVFADRAGRFDVRLVSSGQSVGQVLIRGRGAA
jgi:hypothetical protein